MASQGQPLMGTSSRSTPAAAAHASQAKAAPKPKAKADPKAKAKAKPGKTIPDDPNTVAFTDSKGRKAKFVLKTTGYIDFFLDNRHKVENVKDVCVVGSCVYFDGSKRLAWVEKAVAIPEPSAETLKKLEALIHESMRKTSLNMYWSRSSVRCFVYVSKATGLRGADIGGKSDPYCVISVPSRKTIKGMAHQTRFLSRNLNPAWGESFEVEEYHVGDELQFTVLDHDYMKSDDFLGVCSLTKEQLAPGTFDGKLVLKDDNKHGKGMAKKIKGELHVRVDIVGPPTPVRDAAKNVISAVKDTAHKLLEDAPQPPPPTTTDPTDVKPVTPADVKPVTPPAPAPEPPAPAPPAEEQSAAKEAEKTIQVERQEEKKPTVDEIKPAEEKTPIEVHVVIEKKPEEHQVDIVIKEEKQAPSQETADVHVSERDLDLEATRKDTIAMMFLFLGAESVKGRVGYRGLKKYAEACGFTGDEETWVIHYSEVCMVCRADPAEGLNLEMFTNIVNTKAGQADLELPALENFMLFLSGVDRSIKRPTPTWRAVSKNFEVLRKFVLLIRNNFATPEEAFADFSGGHRRRLRAEDFQASLERLHFNGDGARVFKLLSLGSGHISGKHFKWCWTLTSPEDYALAKKAKSRQHHDQHAVHA